MNLRRVFECQQLPVCSAVPTVDEESEHDSPRSPSEMKLVEGPAACDEVSEQ